MKKLFFSLALVAGLGFAAQAQSKQHDAALDGTKLGIGLDFAFPSGNYAKAMDYGVGASINLLVPVAQNLKVVADAGYLNFTSKNFGGTTFSNSFIPLKAGLRLAAFENFYAQGQIGAAIATQAAGKTGFLYGGTIGAEFPVADKMSVDFGVRYEEYTSTVINPSFLGLRAALNFGL